jgi:hypothetical protein
MPSSHRFLDSLPIRIGVRIIWVVITLVATVLIASYGFGWNGPVGASVLWISVGIILGLGFIFVGIGQTIVRRRATG